MYPTNVLITGVNRYWYCAKPAWSSADCDLHRASSRTLSNCGCTTMARCLHSYTIFQSPSSLSPCLLPSDFRSENLHITDPMTIVHSTAAFTDTKNYPNL